MEMALCPTQRVAESPECTTVESSGCASIWSEAASSRASLTILQLFATKIKGRDGRLPDYHPTIRAGHRSRPRTQRRHGDCVRRTGPALLPRNCQVSEGTSIKTRRDHNARIARVAADHRGRRSGEFQGPSKPPLVSWMVIEGEGMACSEAQILCPAQSQVDSVPESQYNASAQTAHLPVDG